MPTETAKPHLLNNRYRLNECLFNNELGQLYHARDTRYSSKASAGATVLIHFFPANAIRYNSVPATYRRLKKLIHELKQPVLPVLDYGWEGTDAYFVMAAPDSWSIKVLPELNSKPSNLHQQAIQISHELLTGQYIKSQLASQAFLVIPGGVKLLGTALSGHFQEIQPERNLLPVLTHKRYNKITSGLLGLGVLTAIAVAGGIYYFHHLFTEEYLHVTSKIIDPTPEEQVMGQATQDLFIATARPSEQSIAQLTITTDKVPSRPGEAKTTDKAEIIIDDKIISTDEAETIADEESASTDEIEIINETETINQRRAGSEGSRERPIPNIDYAILTANGMTSEQLIEKAYAAIQQGALDEKPGSGSIYFIRLLKRIAPEHPQIRRLSREVASAYHIKTRVAIRAKDQLSAKRHLWIAGRIIKEFELEQMDKAQIILRQHLMTQQHP